MVTYRYNAAGQRIYKKVGSQTPEHYIVDGEQTVAVVKDGMVDYWNIVANGVAGRYEPGSGNKFYYLKDHLGSTRAVVDGNGTVKEALDYYPYGLLMPGRTYQSGSETKEKFTGKERDSETGLDYFGARYYWSAGIRWLSVDPRANERPWESPYIYTRNNSVNAIDSDGRFWEELKYWLRGYGWKKDEQLINTQQIPVELNDPNVKKELDKAWDDSKPDDYLKRHEESGTILRKDDEYIVHRDPSGELNTSRNTNPSEVEAQTGGEAVSEFHTHPIPEGERQRNGRAYYQQEPGPPDQDRAQNTGLPHIVIGRKNIYLIKPTGEVINLGPRPVILNTWR